MDGCPVGCVRALGRARLEPGLVVLGIDDLLGAADGADEHECEQPLIVVVARRAVVQMVAWRCRERHEARRRGQEAAQPWPFLPWPRGALPPPLRDGHLRRDRALHPDDRPVHELLGDRGTHAASAKSNPSANAATRAASSGPDQAAPQSQTQVLSHAR